MFFDDLVGSFLFLFRMVNFSIWAACAGVSNVELLPGKAAYFPQGHIEQYTNSDDIKALCALLPSPRVRVVSVTYLADTVTDEVYAEIMLSTDISEAVEPEPAVAQLPLPPGFVKVLDCIDVVADSCYINQSCLGVNTVFSKDKVALPLEDIHGKVWNFELSYDSTLQRHCISNGWRLFLAAKKLHIGDSLIFVKHDGILTLGIRRKIRRISKDCMFNCPRLCSAERTTRLGSVKFLGDAIGWSYYKNKIFPVHYYPTLGSSCFVVNSVNLDFSPWNNLAASVIGVKVEKKGMVMVRDQLMMVKYRGTICAVPKGIPWRQVKVKWENNHYGQLEAMTNFWEIVLVKKRTLQDYLGNKQDEESPGNKKHGNKPDEESPGNKKELTLFGKSFCV